MPDVVDVQNFVRQVVYANTKEKFLSVIYNIQNDFDFLNLSYNPLTHYRTIKRQYISFVDWTRD